MSLVADRHRPRESKGSFHGNGSPHFQALKARRGLRGKTGNPCFAYQGAATSKAKLHISALLCSSTRQMSPQGQDPVEAALTDWLAATCDAIGRPLLRPPVAAADLFFKPRRACRASNRVRTWPGRAASSSLTTIRRPSGRYRIREPVTAVHRRACFTFGIS